jgi:hypothetical protein
MAKPRDELAGLDRVFARLDEATPGLHDITPFAAALPDGLPEPLIELYGHCDGARLFHDSVEIAASAAVERDDAGRWRFGALEGEPVSIDARGRIWRADPSLDDDVCEGSRLDRWLAGVVDAVAMLYDGDGEFDDGLFDDDGELLPAVAERQLRAQLKRDPRAVGARWRLAHALLAQGNAAGGRGELEDVVKEAPEFIWGWLDLARLSERGGELGGALEEAREAAAVATKARHAQAGYFWAQVARLAGVAGDEAARADAAKQAAALAPGMRAEQMAGVRDSMAAGDGDSARGLMALLRAVWPRDVEVLALARDIEKLGN